MLVTFGWIAGWAERIGFGTSIVLVPLHNPMHLAKEVATLQELSGGRFTLGVGMGWHKDNGSGHYQALSAILGLRVCPCPTQATYSSRA
jgi:alkanesulfonate monooxygenase SsuD/methylene tetrahydromethanopterin reductase-like flavin-dependent oxidoreductase (luciferase family)